MLDTLFLKDGIMVVDNIDCYYVTSEYKSCNVPKVKYKTEASKKGLIKDDSAITAFKNKNIDFFKEKLNHGRELSRKEIRKLLKKRK